MFRKIVLPALTALVGLLIGTASVEYIHRDNLQRSKEVFTHREKCKSLADRYIAQNTSDETLLNLRKVDFSTANNSCIAAVESYTTYGSASEQGWELVDLLSSEVTNVGSCSIQRNCGDGRDIRFSNRLDILFKSAIEGTKPPKDVSNK